MVTQGSHLEPVDTKGSHPHLTALNSVLTPLPPGAPASTMRSCSLRRGLPWEEPGASEVGLSKIPAYGPAVKVQTLSAGARSPETDWGGNQQLSIGNLCSLLFPAVALKQVTYRTQRLLAHNISPHCPVQLLPGKLLIHLSSELALTLHLSGISPSTWVKACLLDSSPYDLRPTSPFCTSASSSRE